MALAAALLLLFVAATLAGLPRAADTLPSLAVALLVHASAAGFGERALTAAVQATSIPTGSSTRPATDACGNPRAP